MNYTTTVKGALLALTLTSGLSATRAQGIRLAEVSTAAASYLDALGFQNDWVEVVKVGDGGESLAGYGLSDRRDEPFRFRFAEGYLERGQRIVLASWEYPEEWQQFSFGLSGAGETVYLTSPSGVTVDSVAYPATPLGYTYARASDTGAWGFAAPSPGTANPARVFTRIAPAVEIGVGTPPMLEIGLADSAAAGTNVQVRYTTDGSEPTDASPLYEGGATVNSRAVIRARAFLADAIPGPIATRTLLPDVPTDLPVLALTVDPADVFDPVRGIWEKGPNASPFDPFAGANYYANERIEAHFELFEATEDASGLRTGASDYANGAALRVYGNFSRQLPQKSSALGSREVFGSRDHDFDHPFFPTWPGRRKDFRNLLLRNGGNDFAQSHIRDGLCHTLARRTAAFPLAYQPISLYVNGQYWGLQALRERPNEATVARREGVNEDDIDLIENRGNIDPLSEPPNAGNLDAYRDLLAFFDSGVLAGPNGYDSLAARFDLDNFFDYYTTQLYSANYDWPGNNNRLYRVREPGARWHYLLYDLDYTFGLDGSATSGDRRTLQRLVDPVGASFPNPPQATRFFREAMANPDVRTAFGNRVADLLNFDYHPETVRATIDSLVELVGPEVIRHRARWDPRREWELWRDNIDSLNFFATIRPRVLREGLRDELGFGAEVDLSLAVAGPADAGDIVLNDYRKATAFPWRGRYFSGTPIQLRAEARPGYVFVRWEGLPAGVIAEGNVVTADPAALTNSVTAVFAVNNTSVVTVFVNEINYNSPEDIGAGDWVELHNPTSEAIDLSQFVLTDQSADNRYDLPAGTNLPANGYLVIAREPDRFTAAHPDVTTFIGPFDFGLGNGGDLVALSDETGRLVDSIRYDDEAPWPEAADGDGPTLELIPGTLNADDRDSPSNWQASNPIGGTPGARNSESTSVREARAVVALRAWPSPASAVVTVAHEGMSGVLAVTDLLGREVVRVSVPEGSSATELPVGGLSAGLYVARLSDGRGRVLGLVKIVKD